jgi:acyl-CoA thioester hydrolase
VSAGEPIRLTLQLLDCDDKRLHIFHAMFHGRSGELLATGEQLLAHVDMRVGRSIAMPPELQAKVQAIRAAHAGLPKPAQAGQPIGIRRKSP